MRIPHPRIETIRRRAPGQLSIGDYGIATTTTALIDFIDSLQNAGISEVSGYSLRHSVPFYWSSTAADVLLDPMRAPSDIGWACWRADVSWSAVPKRNEQLVSRTQTEYVSANHVRFSVVASGGGRILASGRLHYVRVLNARDAPSRRVIAEPGKGDLVSSRYTPFLVSLLMNPIAGGKEPLGRRLHPLGSLPLAALVFQAAKQHPERSVVSASITYLSPMRTDVGFTVTTERNEEEVRVVMTNDAGIRFATGKAMMGTA